VLVTERIQRILDRLDDEDVDAKAERVGELGGLMVESPHEITGSANICLFKKPSGVIFAMLQRVPRS
jgi:predicted enzyme related to lactoylglutathione lyase